MLNSGDVALLSPSEGFSLVMSPISKCGSLSAGSSCLLSFGGDRRLAYVIVV